MKTKTRPAFVGSVTQLGDSELTAAIGGSKTSRKAPKPAPETYLQVTLETITISSY